MSFGNKWIKPHTENVGNRLFEGLKPQAPLKPRIEEAQNRLHLQISKLDSISAKMQEKDQLIFKRIVNSLQTHDSHYAKVLSSELSQVRKMKQMAMSAKLALEQIQLRLNTITELGDVVVTLSPAMTEIKGLQGKLSSMPKADQSLGEISNLLDNIMNESGHIPTADIAPSNSGLNEEAMKIIEEASTIVEESMKDKFPDLPSTTTMQTSKTEASLF
jgi:division protein CdvB (Snf7/Vps24/ESCRT-III family)